jgi:hypothetical protein
LCFGPNAFPPHSSLRRNIRRDVPSKSRDLSTFGGTWVMATLVTDGDESVEQSTDDVS